jgi:ubiquitin C-terminal hydrolase
MYKTKNITKEALKALKIKNQDEIVDLTGSKLDPVKAWEVIKSTSEDFSKSDAKAQEADALLYEMLHPKMQQNDKRSDAKEIIRLQEKERARALDLLELELLIAA